MHSIVIVVQKNKKMVSSRMLFSALEPQTKMLSLCSRHSKKLKKGNEKEKREERGSQFCHLFFFVPLFCSQIMPCCPLAFGLLKFFLLSPLPFCLLACLH